MSSCSTVVASDLQTTYIAQTDYLTRWILPMVVPHKPSRSSSRKGGGSRISSALAARGWKLEDAKARFSEVVRLARSEGPQRVSVRGKDAVVVMSIEELERLRPTQQPQPLIDFLEALNLGELNLDRDEDHGRDVVL